MGDILYELNDFEKYNFYSNCLGDYIVMVTTIIENDDANKSLNQNDFKKACVYLQDRHPCLRSFIARDDTKIFIKMHIDGYQDKINLKWLNLTNQEFDRDKLTLLAEKENCEIFDFTKDDLIWRIQVISFKEHAKSMYMVNFSMGFFATDGFNMCALSIELVNIINSLLNNQECEEMMVKLGPIEGLYEYCDQNNLVKQSNFDEIKKRKDNPYSKFLLSEKLNQNNETGFKLKFLKYDQQITSKMIHISKKNRVRLTSFFYVVCIYSLKELYDRYGIEFPRDILIAIAASLRIRYNPSLNFSHIRTHTCHFEYPLKNDQFGNFKDFWEDVRTINELIQEKSKIDNGILFSITHDFESLENINNLFANEKNTDVILKDLSEHKTCDMGFSNLGSYVNDHVSVLKGPLEIKEMYCSDSIQTSPSISLAFINHIIYWKGEMMLQFGVNKSKIDSIRFEEFIEIYKNTILKVLI